MTTVLLTHDPVALDLYYGEKALDGLRALGVDLRLHEGARPLAGEALIAAADAADIVISYRGSPGEADVFERLPRLTAFMRCAVDIRNVDVEAASRNGVLVTRASPGFAASVSELILGQVIDLARGITASATAYHRGKMPPASMGRQLAGSTLGIVGYGVIGQHLAPIALAIGMKVLITDPCQGVDDSRFEQVGMPDLLARADIIVCLAVANEETENLFDAEAFASVKPGALFINPSRGNLVDEAALESALASGRLAGAALDVGRAPDQMPSPHLARLPNVIATPHIGGLTPAAIEAQSLETVEQVRTLLEGEVPKGAVNADRTHRLKRFGIDPKGGKSSTA
ncbi:MAG: NAD(P)-dependent oxidoreductase [Geminicoccaceae bacterium]